jgi:endoglucanase
VSSSQGPAAGPPSAASLPRWRGFNLLEKFSVDRPERNTAFREEDFELIARSGFDFVRLPMDYRAWTDEHGRFREPVLQEIDRAVAWGGEYGVHVDLNFHRAPGYCVNVPAESSDLWTDERTQEVCAAYWAAFAVRYRGIPNERLSFNLLNEPKDVDGTTYTRVIQRLVDAIREHDPGRLIIVDGVDGGWTPIPSLAGLGVAQSLHAYRPGTVTHYRATWVDGAERWNEPTWPLEGDPDGDASRLRKRMVDPWLAVGSRGVGIHVGEFGTFNRTPHWVTLAWMEDVLGLLRQAGWGWCLWNLRGAYGPLDSARDDVAYEELDGHRLDRAMWELLRDW